jgi:hypothetical protein
VPQRQTVFKKGPWQIKSTHTLRTTVVKLCARTVFFKMIATIVILIAAHLFEYALKM